MSIPPKNKSPRVAWTTLDVKTILSPRPCGRGGPKDLENFAINPITAIATKRVYSWRRFRMAFMLTNTSVALKSSLPQARFLWFIMLLALPLLLGAKSRKTNDQILYRESFLQVVSPDGATEQQAKEMAKKVLAAWKFDLNVMHWSHPEEMKGPLTLRLLSHDRMKREHGGARATAASSGNKFTVDMNLIGDESIDRTFAHELGHVQMYRAIGKYSERSDVPHYFLEGHGQMLNQLYSDHLGQDRSGPGANIVRTMMSFTAEEAHDILTDPSYFKVGTAAEKENKTNRMERMGLYFVEYLRVRKEIPDTVPRMGRVFELVGRGKTYEQAFKQAYGLSLDRTVSEIVTYFKQTETHPADRVKGTRFEAYLP